MKLLITFSKKAPFLNIQSADSAEKKIAVLQAELNEVIKKSHHTANWAENELAFINGEISTALDYIKIATETIEKTRNSLTIAGSTEGTTEAELFHSLDLAEQAVAKKNSGANNV